jgi:general secretion pathway protein K
MTQILATSRTALNLAENLRAAAQAREADDGAIHEAIFHALAAGSAQWMADGQPHALVIGGIGVNVTVGSLEGMVNPNTASLALLTGLVRAAGASADEAAGIASNIVLWRAPAPSPQAAAMLLQQYRAAGLAYGPPASRFTEIGQVSDVLGVTPALFAALKPHLSLFQPGDPEAAAADPVVRQAIAFASATGPAGSGAEGAPAVSITACAAGPAPLCRHAVVSLPGLAAPAPFVIEQLADGRLRRPSGLMRDQANAGA